MTDAEFQPYREKLIRGYAGEKASAGYWSVEESLSRSEHEISHLLPDGLTTRNHYLLSIRDSALAKNIGILWFAVVNEGGQSSAFIYDFEIDVDLRGKGYGMQALQALEQKVKALGLDKISLHVFGYNHTARALYEKLGYQMVNINMAKKLN
jgi:ribosomal protein S18 acetylase RimI-like enzyme